MTNYQRNTVHGVDDIRAIADHAGSFFFSPSTMRAFSSRILEGVYPAASNGEDAHAARVGAVFFFVTSERHGDDAPRHYAVRRATLGTVRDNRPAIDIVTEGDEYFANARAARSAAKEFAEAN